MINNRVNNRISTDIFLDMVYLSCSDIYPYAFVVSKNKNEAIELMIRAYLVGWCNIDSYDSRAGFVRWIRKVLVNLAMDSKNTEEPPPGVFTVDGVDRMIRPAVKAAIRDIRLSRSEKENIHNCVMQMII